MKKVTFYVVVVLLLSFPGCKSKLAHHPKLPFLKGPIQPDEFVPAGTPEFRRQEKKLHLSHQEASETVREYREKKFKRIVEEHPEMKRILENLEESKDREDSTKKTNERPKLHAWLYKEWYIFSSESKIGTYVRLNGLWINGNTGEIHEVSKGKVQLND